MVGLLDAQVPALHGRALGVLRGGPGIVSQGGIGQRLALINIRSIAGTRLGMNTPWYASAKVGLSGPPRAVGRVRGDHGKSASVALSIGIR